MKQAWRILSFGLLFWSLPAWSYMSVMDTGEVLEKGQYRAIAEPKLLFDKVNGGEIVGRGDMYLNDSMDLRVLAGVGAIDFETGAFLKWVPIPDTANQPAIGVAGGVTYARYLAMGETSIRIHPIISKKFESDVGLWTPYASIPLGIAARTDGTTVPIHLAFGTQFQSTNWKNLQFMAELGINLSNSYSYLGAGVLFYFDGAKGFTLN